MPHNRQHPEDSSLNGLENLPESAALWAESADIKAIKAAFANGALDKLSPEQRRAFQLVILAGKTEEDAAEMMGCNRSTVRTHVRRAAARLKKIIEAQMSPMDDPAKLDNHRVKPAPLSDSAWDQEG